MQKKDLHPIKTQQLKLDLFDLDPLLDKNYSNTLEIYDIAGKFLYDKQNKYLSSATADETEFTRTVAYKEFELKVSVTAANIERVVEGKTNRTFVFPGAREEIIEDVLRKLCTENRAEAYIDTAGNHKEGTKFIGISFTLYEIFLELKRVGKSYSYSEIREALTIMNRSILTIKNSDGSMDLTAPFFPIVAIADKANPSETKSFVCFHPMVTELIHTQKFKRYNYLKAFEYSRHYTRIVYKRLCHRWKQAGPGKPYSILLSTLIAALKDPYPNLYQDKALFEKVFEDLKESGVLSEAIMTPKKEGKKITDWLCDLYASEGFAKQMASNNKVANRVSGKENQERLESNNDLIEF